MGTHPYERRSLIAELSAHGVRITAQRRALLSAIQEADEHLDAASLLERARKQEPNLDRATVYRTLELLKKLRLIDELDLMHLHGEKHYYEVKTRQDHMHLACFGCGKIVELATPLFEQLKSEVAATTGFAVKVTRLEVGGHCPDCKGELPS